MEVQATQYEQLRLPVKWIACISRITKLYLEYCNLMNRNGLFTMFIVITYTVQHEEYIVQFPLIMWFCQIIMLILITIMLIQKHVIYNSWIVFTRAIIDVLSLVDNQLPHKYVNTGCIKIYRKIISLYEIHVNKSKILTSMMFLSIFFTD